MFFYGHGLTDCVDALELEHPELRGSLEVGPTHHGVHPLLELQPDRRALWRKPEAGSSNYFKLRTK
jgi:hypothetical protein